MRMRPGGGLRWTGACCLRRSEARPGSGRPSAAPRATQRRSPGAGRLDSGRRPARQRRESSVRQPGPSRHRLGSHAAPASRRTRPAVGLRPQDAPVERVAARFLGRLDGLDGTSSAGLWGRLALEVVTVRRPERLADTRSLRWHASWGQWRVPRGVGRDRYRRRGTEMLLDLTQQQVTVHRRPFRVRTLPDWEREQAAHDLRLSPRRLMAWPVVLLLGRCSRTSTTSRPRPWPRASGRGRRPHTRWRPAGRPLTALSLALRHPAPVSGRRPGRR